jgi:hypothetical protein
VNIIKTAIKLIVFPFVLCFGIILFLFTKSTQAQAYAALRFYFVYTNGLSNNIASNLISLFIPKYTQKNANGVLGNLTLNDQNKIVSAIERDGFYIFDKFLNETDINDIYNYATKTKVSYLDFEKDNIKFSKEKVLFNEENPLSPRYQFNGDEIIKNDTIQKLIFDESLLAIANLYLKTKPIIDLAVMWWSIPYSAKAENKAAQMYHFDMDRFKFLKFFFYINDVTTDNGPHCYIKNSHKKLPKEVLKDRRLNDKEVEQFFSKEQILEITGKKGSIIAVDTRGLHKGKPLVKDKRLLFQIQFSNSLFGASYNKINDISLSQENLLKKKKLKRTYQLIGN